MGLTERIREALSNLLGMPLCAASRAGGMATLQFGDCRRHAVHGREAIVGTYALHVQCPWRLVAGARVVTGSGDFLYPDDDKADWTDFDPDRQPSRYTGRMAAWLAQSAPEDRSVVEVAGTALGDFTIRFAGGALLQAFAADSLEGDDSERWRLFKPGSDDEHFVVCATALG